MPHRSEQSLLLFLAMAKDEWRDEMLSNSAFGILIEEVLSPMEHQVIESKIDDMSDTEVAKMFGIKLITVKSHKSNILSKLRNGIDTHAERQLNKFLRRKR